MRKLAFLEDFATRHDLLYQHTDGSDSYIYSRDMRYRYAFARCWEADGPLILWVGVNPAKGDTEQRRRPTVERCIAWSRSWGAAGLIFANLFAARHNRPVDLRSTLDPVGPHNDEVLRELSAIAERTVLAWGNWGRLHGRGKDSAHLFNQPLCLGVTAKGQPRHPLYVRGNTTLERWSVG